MSFFRLRKKKSIHKKISAILSDACKMLGEGSLIILSSVDGFLIGVGSNRVPKEFNDELLAGLFTLVWKTGKKVSTNLNIGRLDYVQFMTREKNIFIYKNPNKQSLLITAVTDLDVASLVIREVCERILRKIEKTFNHM